MSTVEIVWAMADGTAEQAENLLRNEVAIRCSLEPTNVKINRLCTTCGSAEHGKPFLSFREGVTPSVSISRSPDLVVVAFADAGLLGIDVERADAPAFAGFEGVALHPDETAATIRDRAITWVRKESLLKATGDGLRIDPSTVRLSDPDSKPELLEWTSATPRPAYTWISDIQIDPEHVAAVTLLSGEAPEIRMREAMPGAQAD